MACNPLSRKEKFILEWYAEDLEQMSFTPGYVLSHHEFPDMRPDDGRITNWRGGYIVVPRVAGTPTQEMFHRAGILGTRREIAARLRAVANGRSRHATIRGLANLLADAFNLDEERFDWEQISARLPFGHVHWADLRTPMIYAGKPDLSEPVRSELGIDALVSYPGLEQEGTVVAGPDDKGRYRVRWHMPADPTRFHRTGSGWFPASSLAVQVPF